MGKIKNLKIEQVLIGETTNNDDLISNNFILDILKLPNNFIRRKIVKYVKKNVNVNV